MLVFFGVIINLNAVGGNSTAAAKAVKLKYGQIQQGHTISAALLYFSGNSSGYFVSPVNVVFLLPYSKLLYTSTVTLLPLKLHTSFSVCGLSM